MHITYSYNCIGSEKSDKISDFRCFSPLEESLTEAELDQQDN